MNNAGHELLRHKNVETTIPQGGTRVLNRGGRASGLRPTAVAVDAGQPKQELGVTSFHSHLMTKGTQRSKM